MKHNNVTRFPNRREVTKTDNRVEKRSQPVKKSKRKMFKDSVGNLVRTSGRVGLDLFQSAHDIMNVNVSSNAEASPEYSASQLSGSKRYL